MRIRFLCKDYYDEKIQEYVALIARVSPIVLPAITEKR
jgi:hypothetical protein